MCIESPTMVILLLSSLGGVPIECTVAGFEAICCSFAHDEVKALFGCKLAMKLFALAQGFMYFLRRKEFSYRGVV